MLVTPLGSSVGVGVGSGKVVLDVELVMGGGLGEIVNEDGGGVTVPDVSDPGGGVGVELGGGGGSVVLEGWGGSSVGEDTGGVGSVGLSPSVVDWGGGGSVVEVTIPVPGGVVSGIVTGVEVSVSGSSGMVVAFWTGGSTLVITETTSLTIDSIGLRGSLVVGSAVVVGVGVVDSLTTPVGAITIPVLELVVVGARETGAESDAGSGSEVGGFEIGFAGPSDG
jgi:hypothetical protein